MVVRRMPVPRSNFAIHRSRLMMPGLIVAALSGAGCTHRIDVQPIRVEPIYLTVDVNVRLDKQLEESFGFEDRIERQVDTTTTAPATQPAPVATPSTDGGSKS